MMKTLDLNRYITNRNFLILLLLSFIFNIHLLAEKLNYPVKTVNGVECYVYTVKKSEGIYRVSLNLNTTEDIILKHNPQVSSGLKEGMKIYVPVEGNQSLKSNSATEKKFIEHVVEKKQTIFRIIRQYNITEEELIELNPQLKNRAVNEGEILRIPVKTEIITPVAGNEQVVSVKPVETPVVTPVEKSEVSKIIIKKPDTLNIAFLLPFMTEQKPEYNDSRFIEFYSGALVAVQEATKKGYNFNIFTFDTEKTDLKLMEILQNNNLEHMNLIVGPAYASQVSVIGDYSRMFRVKTLIPFSSKIYDLDINPYIFQFNPGQDNEINKILEIIQAKNPNIIFAELPGIPLNDEGNQLVQSLKTVLNQSFVPYTVITTDPTVNTNFQRSIIPQKENLIFFNTNKINSLISYFKELTSLPESKFMKIYEPYSWRGTSIETPPSFYFSVFQNDANTEAYNNYQHSFNQLFDWTPIHESPRYDLLGYDLLNYFIFQVLSSENSETKSYPLYQGVQSQLQFEKTSDKGGYINKQLNYYE